MNTSKESLHYTVEAFTYFTQNAVKPYVAGIPWMLWFLFKLKKTHFFNLYLSRNNPIEIQSLYWWGVLAKTAALDLLEE